MFDGKSNHPKQLRHVGRIPEQTKRDVVNDHPGDTAIHVNVRLRALDGRETAAQTIVTVVAVLSSGNCQRLVRFTGKD